MRVASLGSGSQGNATLIAEGDLLVLVDSGFSAIEIERRMARLGCHPSDLAAILLTHEHADHTTGVGPLSRKYDAPVWTTPGTHAAVRDNRFADTRFITLEQPFTLGGLRITPFAVPHDAREPCQFRFDADGRGLGLLTDAGSITPHIVETLQGCDALLLEFNYDPEMLARGPYPPALRRRIDGAWGHLSNHQARCFLDQRNCPRLNQVAAMHISEKNNTRGKVDDMLRAASVSERCDLTIASQDEGFGWLTVE